MTSILTNNGAMVALQTLKGINNQLGTIQEQISTGKKVGTAKDNAAVWAISKTMEADVTGFNKISEGLAVAKSTVAVARDASETVTELLTQMKDKITQAQGDTVDADSRAKIQADINALRSQVESVVGSAQLNGRNLVDGTTNSPMNVLSSLDRAIDGTVKAANISVNTVNLTTDQGTTITPGAYLTSGGAAAGGGGVETIAVATFLDATGAAAAPAGSGALARTDIAVDPSDLTATPTANAGLVAGDVLTFNLGTNAAPTDVEGVNYIEVKYTVKTGDTGADVSAGLAEAINGRLGTALAFDVDGLGTTANTDLQVRVNETTGALEIVNNGAAAVSAASTVSIERNKGALSGLASIDVSNAANAATAMTDIEGMIQASIDAASAFGTAQNQIETQAKFVSKLTDNLKAGIGSMIDADMEEASARLQALQVQQQLGVQSLSIANQAPQSVLSLFR